MSAAERATPEPGTRVLVTDAAFVVGAGTDHPAPTVAVVHDVQDQQDIGRLHVTATEDLGRSWPRAGDDFYADAWAVAP